MTRIFCGHQIPSRFRHYSGDACPALVDALGAVTPAGRAREADTRYHPDSMEQARQAPKCMHAGKVRRGARVMRKIRA